VHRKNHFAWLYTLIGLMAWGASVRRGRWGWEPGGRLKPRCVKWGLVLAVYALSGCAAMVAEVLIVPATVLVVGAVVGAIFAPAVYRSQAEKEIKSGTYDPDLWAEALVLVDGDEEKRYAKYIVLRAEQLYREAQAPKLQNDQYDDSPLFTSTVSDVQPELNDQSEIIPDLTGTYVSDIRGGPTWMFRDRKPRLSFKLRGKKIIGTNISQTDNEIIGTRKGDTIKFEYWGPHRLISGEWNISPGGDRLVGTWEEEEGRGTWDLTRIQ